MYICFHGERDTVSKVGSKMRNQIRSLNVKKFGFKQNLKNDVDGIFQIGYVVFIDGIRNIPGSLTIEYDKDLNRSNFQT